MLIMVFFLHSPRLVAVLAVRMRVDHGSLFTLSPANSFSSSAHAC
jgi:hypothetical protein